jgi:hypothetical protein
MGLTLARALLKLLARATAQEEELGMARQRKTLPARRNAMDDSLLIRSAESLGRMIGSLQRQLDAARRLAAPAAVDRVDQRGNGHAPARTRSGVSAKAATKTKPAAKSRTTNARKRSAKNGGASKNR